MPPDVDVGTYRRLMQEAALDDSSGVKMLDLVHFVNNHVELDSLELEMLLQFLRSRCERMLYSKDREATPIYLSVQFGIARLIALKAHDLERCLLFLIRCSVSWPVCQQLPSGQSITDLIASIDAGIQVPIIQNEGESRLIQLLAICFILTKKPASAVSILSQVRDPDEHLCLLQSIALYYKSRLLGDASLIDLALEALSSELDGMSASTTLYGLYFMKGYLLCCEQRFIEAIGNFKTCLSGEYRRHEACLMIGICLIESGSLDTAVDFLQRAILDKRVQVLSAFNVAVIKELQCKLEEASAIQSAILEECNNNSEAEAGFHEAVIIRLINLCLAQNKATDALKLAESLVCKTRISLEAARVHIYALLSCNDRYESVLSHCESYLSIFSNDVVLLMYMAEACFVLERFDDCIAKCDQAIAACSHLQDSRNQLGSEPKTKHPRVSENPVSFDVSNSLDIAQMKAYMNKGLCFACLNRSDQAIAMMQWALFHHQSKEAEFNLCVLLIKTGLADIGCARWLQYKGIDLSLSGNAYKEQIDRIADSSGCIRPRSHVAGHLTDEQDRNMTRLVLEQWIKIRSDHAFTRSLQEILQSC